MGSLQPWHIILVVVVAIVLFGSKRLPDATRSIGRSLRIFKAETKGMMSDEDGNPVSKEQQQQQYTAQQAQQPQGQQQAQPPQQLPSGDGTTINGQPLSTPQPTTPQSTQGPQNPS